LGHALEAAEELGAHTLQYKASARKGPRIDRRVPGDHFVSPENGAFARKATFSAASKACATTESADERGLKRLPRSSAVFY
jgi:hypothetical protein